MKLTQTARKLRKDQTPWEIIIWRMLRDRRFIDYKFRRQFPIDKYVVDFCCLEKRFIIELDGGHHNQPAKILYDEKRKLYLESRKFRILRLWNSEVGQNLDGVKEKILQLLEE